MTMPPLPAEGDTDWYEWGEAVHDAAEAVNAGRLTETALQDTFEEWATTGGLRGTVTVQHGANAAVARPDVGTGTVRWIGSVQPAAMTDTDVWFEVPAGFDPLTAADWMGAWYADAQATTQPTGTEVTSWLDAATSTLPLTPSGPLHTGAATLHHSVGIYNGQPAVEFDASPLSTPAFTSMAMPYTVVLVGNVSTVGTDETFFHNEHPGGGGSLYSGSGPKWVASPGGPEVTSHATTSPHIFIVTYSSNPAEGRLRVDGTEELGDSTADAITRFRLGVWNDTGADFLLAGHIAFCAIKAGTLDAGEITDLETWAAGKYGITV